MTSLQLSQQEERLLIAAINPDATVAIKAWEEWAAEARLEEAPYSELRLLPAVYAHLSRIAPSLSLPNKLRGKARSTFTLNRLLAHESLPIVHEMSRQTQVLLTKGIAMCVRFNAWSSRLMGDIDIYVSTAALEKVCEFLAQSGWTPHYGMTWASLVHRSSLRRNSWNLTKGNAQLDLHWRLMYADGPAEDWLTRNMWETAQPTELLGLRLLTQSPEFALITSLDHGFNFGTRADAVQTVIDATSLLPACRSDQLIHLLEKADLGEPLRQVASTLEKAGLYKMVSDIAEKYRGVLGKTVGETDLKRRRGLSLARSKPEKVVLRRPALYLLWQALGRKAWVERLLLRLNGPLSKPLAWSGTFREDYDLRECSDMDQIAGPGWGWPEPGRTCFWSDRADARLLIPLLHMGDHLIVLGLAENRLGSPNGYVRIFLNGIFWGAINVKERLSISEYCFLIPRRLLFGPYVEISFRPKPYRGKLAITPTPYYALMRSIPVRQLRVFDVPLLNKFFSKDLVEQTLLMMINAKGDPQGTKFERIKWKIENSPYRKDSKLPEDFDPALYVLSHLDLIEHEVDPYDHFIHHGQREGRPWS